MGRCVRMKLTAASLVARSSLFLCIFADPCASTILRTVATPISGLFLKYESGDSKSKGCGLLHLIVALLQCSRAVHCFRNPVGANKQWAFEKTIRESDYVGEFWNKSIQKILTPPPHFLLHLLHLPQRAQEAATGTAENITRIETRPPSWAHFHETTFDPTFR